MDVFGSGLGEETIIWVAAGSKHGSMELCGSMRGSWLGKVPDRVAHPGMTHPVHSIMNSRPGSSPRTDTPCLFHHASFSRFDLTGFLFPLWLTRSLILGLSWLKPDRVCDPGPPYPVHLTSHSFPIFLNSDPMPSLSYGLNIFQGTLKKKS